ncbi:hypothetical protein RHSIM_Rhsim10G0125800 [Rhododendron simsii]|uniref:Uncharacterized protein n=1 Tax=Rhododendron simsii TaxID=118357 RepID=A0A834L9V2_RHOSS|nr:hypothetical protein RHSIM_Rhsim10G0125800 [Rhododendron simsii]
MSPPPPPIPSSLSPINHPPSSLMKPTEISLRYRCCPPSPSSLSPINHLLSSTKFNGEVGVIVVAVDFAGANLQEVVFEFLARSMAQLVSKSRRGCIMWNRPQLLLASPRPSRHHPPSPSHRHYERVGYVLC